MKPRVSLTAPLPSLTLASTLTVTLALTLTPARTIAAIEAQAPRSSAAARSAPRPGPPQPTTLPSSAQTCEFITPDEAKILLGYDATAATAPSKGLFTSCGYTSPTGDAVTVYLSDYGLPFVAKQFYDKTRELLKTPVAEETALGVPAAFSYVIAGAAPAAQAPGAPPPAAPAPPPAAGAPAPPPSSVMTFVALKDQRIVKLEASGPTVTLPHRLPKLRAVLTRVLGTLPAPAPQPKPDAPR